MAIHRGPYGTKKAPPLLLLTNGGRWTRRSKVAISTSAPAIDYLSIVLISGRFDMCRRIRSVSGGLVDASRDALLNNIKQSRAVLSDLIDRQPFK